MRRFTVQVACLVCAHLLLVVQTQAEVITPPGAVVVELIDAGAMPRRELRFTPTQGAKQVSVMTMKMSQSITLGGQAIPAQNIPANKITIESTIDKVFENGDIGFKFTYTDITIVDDPANPSPIATIMKTMMQPLVGTSGTIVLTNRGLTKQVDMLIPEGVSPQLKQLIDGMSGAMNQMSAPVPEEAVGLGSKWSVVQNINANGLQLKQTSVHEMIELVAGGFTLSVTLTQEAEPQEVTNAAMPAGTKVALKSLTSKGAGKTVVDSNLVLPKTVNVEVATQAVMSIDVAGQNQDMTTDMKMAMTLEQAR